MRLTVLVLLFIVPEAIAQYEDALHFNSDFLIFSDGKKTSKPDLNYFSLRDGILPGTYLTEVVINGKHISEEDITFSSDSKGKVHAVYSQSMLEKWGINIPDIPEKDSDIWLKGLSGVLPGAKEQFNSTEQRLLLFIPQQWLQSHNWLKTSPKSWDDGIPALMFNYRYSGVQQHSDLTSSKSETLSLNSGVTLSGWQLRHDGFIGRSTTYKDHHGWQSLNTWARHDYDFFQGGQITIGQQSSDGAIFDSFPFEGIQMSSDDGMIVPWLSRFSPLIRGVAGSVSRIIVRQNNVIIWQGDVPAGPFELRDVNPLFSGDMEVEIRGADGSIRHFTQSSASVPVLQREGRVRYSTAIGRYRRSKIHNPPPSTFMQSSAAIGMSNDFTLYGGVMWADNYSALMAGLGKYNEKIGAFSFDLTSVNYTKRYGNKENSEAIRFSWARDIDSTGTQMNIGAYWYLSPGFYNFNDLQQSQSDVRDNYHLLHPLSRITTSLSQTLPEGGQLSLSIDKKRYFSTSQDSWQTRLSWSVPVGLASTTLAFGYERQPQYNQIDRSLFLSFSLPFNAFSNYEKASLSSNLVTRNGDTFVQTGVTGSTFEQRLSYSIMEGFRNHNKGSEGNLNVRYRGSYGEMLTSWSHQKWNQQWLYGLNGGVVAHRGGVTLTQPLNIDGASALIDTNGAPGIRLNNGTGVSTDWQGYTILSNLVPYQRNDLSLDINSAGKNAEIIGTDLTVIPSRGALVPAKFRVNTGRKALLTLTRIDGSPVPFGSVVSVISDNRTNNYNNIVADDGQVWITGLPEEGEILARWGEGNASECKAHLSLDSNENNFIRSSLTCQ